MFNYYQEQRPADVLIPLLGGGREMALDITVVSPFQQQCLERAAIEPDFALTMRFNQKWNKYGEACRVEGISFCPLILESKVRLGGQGCSGSEEAGAGSSQSLRTREQ